MIKSEKVSFDYIRDIEIDGVKTEERSTALKDVDIDIKDGEFVAILGRNGSGKSTFAKHINALFTPTRGTLWVKGMDTKDESLIWDIRQKAGMVFQNPDNQLVATIVEEDVAFGPENMGVPSEEIRLRVDSALSTVSMDEFKRDTPSKLSGGQKQRIAIAGVLAMKPDCIVLDEPTAMLDPSGRKEVIETIKRLNKEEGITIVLITHYMNETVDADRIIVMDKGKVAISGTPKEIFSQVDMLKGFGLDVPQVTEVCNNLRKMGIDIPADILTVDEMVKEICRLKSTI